MSYFSENLNPAQLEAVTYCDGPSLVIAGAGSGKTRVLTFKIAYLLQNGFQPWNILALTFTNKAAREMNERIAAIVGAERTRQLWSGTFHSIFARILRREAPHIGFGSDFTIYDTTDARALVKAIVKERGLDDKSYKPSAVCARISEAKNRLVLPAQYAADASIRKRDAAANVPETAGIYAEYVRRCRKANALDFDDLLLRTWLFFRDCPEAKEAYRDRFRYILVDEYQDTNFAQHCVISQLTRPDSRICVVGDDAQSIYSFRGADIGHILQFGTQYPSARVIKLERNYRSTRNIVGAANAIIRHNANQIPKEVYSEGDAGDRLRLLSAASDKDESLKVAGEIRRLVRRAGIGYDDIALLYRTNAQSRAFEETFRSLAIPYRIWGGLSFYQHKEVKDVIAYLRLLCNPDDEEAFKRVINYPARGIGATTVGKLAVAAAEHDTSLWQALCRPEAHGVQLGRAALDRLADFRRLIEGLQEAAGEKSAYEVAALTVRASGIGADIHANRSPENLSRQQNVEELLNSIRGYEEEVLEEQGRGRIPLSEFLGQVALLTDTDKREDGTPRVTLMTIHAAKGLEFDTVFVTGMEEDLFPNANARMYPREMEEERRLFYVAVTRAKKRCFLSHARTRYRYGKLEFSEPSPFIDEIPDDYIETENEGTAPSPSGWAERGGGLSRPAFARGIAAGTPGDGNGFPSDERSFLRRGNGFPSRGNGFPSRGNGAASRWKRIAPDGPHPTWDADSSTSDVNRFTPDVNQITSGVDSVMSGAGNPARGADPSVRPTPAGGTARAARPASRADGCSLREGQVIEHERFGRGRVLSVEGAGDSTKACVAFENAGTKNLLLKFARFKVLS